LRIVKLLRSAAGFALHTAAVVLACGAVVFLWTKGALMKSKGKPTTVKPDEPAVTVDLRSMN
jgi:hypothetical protein